MLKHELQGCVEACLWSIPQSLSVGFRGLSKPPQTLERSTLPRVPPTPRRLERYRFSGPTQRLFGVPELQVALGKVAEDLC